MLQKFFGNFHRNFSDFRLETFRFNNKNAKNALRLKLVTIIGGKIRKTSKNEEGAGTLS